MARTERIREVTLEMVTSDEKWPGLVLPLKRHTAEGLQCAYLPDPIRLKMPVAIYMGNMFHPQPDDHRIVYGSVNELLDAGWEVD